MTEFTTRYLKDYQTSVFTTKATNLIFELDDKATKVTSNMRIVRQKPGQKLVLDGEHLKLLSLAINGEEVSKSDYVISDTDLTLNVELDDFELTVVTEISPAENTALEGLYKSAGAYCTQCEAEGFRRITYYQDRPDVLSVFTTKVIADKADFPFLLSNGNKVESAELADGKHTVTWHDPHPKPCYLFALVAGDFELLSDKFVTQSGRDVALEIFVDKGNLAKAAHAMASLKHSMAWDEKVFGLEYDLDIYMIVAVDFFNMGAMENKGLNIFNSKYVLADKTSATDTDYFNIEAVIAHEYFHNWTGNRVTCRDWFQLSLKEGLTVFRDQQFSADLNSAAVGRIQNVRVLRSHQFAEDASPMAHPIRPEKVMEMNNFYTLTVYEKGSEVIRMMHTILGADNFRKGMDLYFERFDGMAVTCDDFVNAMADASGIDLGLFKNWYSQSGTPQLSVQEGFEDGVYSLTIKQSHPETADKQTKKNLHIPIGIELIGSGNHAELLSLTDSEQTWTFDGYAEKPVLAFLTNFSAPVKVDFAQCDEDLAVIMAACQDEFCRWDAGQKLLTGYIQKLAKNKSFELPSSLIAQFERVLAADIDPALIAEQLTLPSFDEIADNMNVVEPGAIVYALETIKAFLANGLSNSLSATYRKLEAAVSDEKQAAANRALKNVVLGYLSLDSANERLVKEQFSNADNMTDEIAALTAATKANIASSESLIKSFEQKWYDTTLVMDKWFSICALRQGDNVFEQLQTMMQHDLFTLDNPNRARSLIGAFAMTNPKYFHCKTGRGYQFLADNINALNKINPQVASRLITPLLAFKRYEPVRRELMKGHLIQLQQKDDLSRDLKEKVDAALAK